MGNHNPICTLRDYSKPSYEGYRNTIELPVGNNEVPLQSDTIRPNFYDHVNPVTRRTFDQSAGGKLRDLNAKESWALLEDLTFYDNKSWNDPRDFAKPVKAIALPQDVLSTSDRSIIELENQVQRLMEAHLALTQPTQVNKVTTQCEICSVLMTLSIAWKIQNMPLLNTHPRVPMKREPLDLVNTSEELVYESLIRRRFAANAYIDVDLPMKIMSLAYYNSIRRNGYEYTRRNFVGLGKDMHIFVGNMSYVMDFTILESIEANIDPSLSNVVFGRPFIKIAYLAINRKYGLMTFTYGITEITFKTPYKDPERSEMSGEGHDLLSSRVILSKDDYDRGCRKPSDLEDGFYRDTSKLGPEYLIGMDYEGEVM
ncbi:hypothetical protein Tco_0158076 [Tanacetum coccineum]